MADKKVNFVKAGDIMAEHAKETQEKGEGATWPKRCATTQLLFRNAKGEIAETDLYASVEVDENGQFNPEARNPFVIHNAPGGVPQHEYCNVMVKDQRREVRTWMDKLLSALTVRFFDIQIPAEEAAPEEAKSPALASPTVDMPS